MTRKSNRGADHFERNAIASLSSEKRLANAYANFDVPP